MFIRTKPLSYSYMPTLKIPTTVNRLNRGIRPAGVTKAWGISSDTGEPTVRSSFQASELPIATPNSPDLSASSLPSTM